MAGVSSKGGLVALTFEVKGMQPLLRVLGTQMAVLKDMRPVWEQIADDFVKREATIFSRQGAVYGWVGWHELAEKYAAWKKLKGFSPKIMVRGGRLLHSLTDRGATDFVYKARRKSLEIGTRVPYARYHQNPKARWVKGRKKRPVIIINDYIKNHWVKLISLYLQQSGQFQRPPRERPPRP